MKMEVVMLGTAAAVPTEHRWPSSLAVLRGGETFLVDCGEGAQMQFQKAQLKPGKLRKIFISHLHGDHFYGLIGLLTSLQLGGRDKPMAIYGPVGLNHYLDFMQEISQFRFKYQVSVHEVEEEEGEKTWDFSKYLVSVLPLDHTLFTLGFRIEEKPKPGTFDPVAADRLGIPEGPVRQQLQMGETIALADGRQIKSEEVVGPPQPGKVVTVCPDTRPCDNAAKLASDADLLIHEGSFDESKTDWADMTGHSTVRQAAEIAKAANAQKLLLTHVSARYIDQDEKRLLSEARAIFPETFLGRDLMRLQV